MYALGDTISPTGVLLNSDGSPHVDSATVSASVLVAGCPENADAWQSQQNGFCADAYGWPLRPDGSAMTRNDIEANARNQQIKKYLPFIAGGALLLFVIGGRSR